MHPEINGDCVTLAIKVYEKALALVSELDKKGFTEICRMGTLLSVGAAIGYDISLLKAFFQFSDLLDKVDRPEARMFETLHEEKHKFNLFDIEKAEHE